MIDILGIFNRVMSVVNAAPKVIAAAPQFIELAQSVMPLFNGAQQDELKSALQRARQRSDEAEADFIKAGRGQ